MAPKTSKSRRKTPAQLEAKIRQLQRSNRVKDALLNIMSYELRTPLNVVMGYTGMMKDGVLGHITAEQEKALAKIIARVKDQLAMINNILLYTTSREDKKVKVEAQAVDLHHFINELRFAYETALEKEVKLVWHGLPEKTLAVMDSGKIKLILQNLIDNAIKFTPGGQVTVSARMAEGSQQKKKNSRREGEKPPAADRLLPSRQRWVEFKVQDTGIGMPRESLPRLLDRFEPTESPGSRPYGGAGMGLYVVKSFTELLGGTVEVESTPGEGSAFTVTIPIS